MANLYTEVQSQERKEVITYVTGDATWPVGDGQKLIAHICNDEGKWGSGFVVALSRRNRIAEDAYRLWHRNRENGGMPFALGQVQMVNFDDGVWVANMIAQLGVRHDMHAPRAVHYGALRAALTKVADYACRGLDAPSVHMPRIGCGLGGGDWRVVEGLINDTLISRDVPVTVYDLPQEAA